MNCIYQVSQKLPNSLTETFQWNTVSKDTYDWVNANCTDQLTRAVPKLEQQENLSMTLRILESQLAILRAEIARIKDLEQSQPLTPAPLTTTYVQQVPDKCDRIVWRNSYWHLPTDAKTSITPVQKSFEDAWKEKEEQGYLYGPDALESVRMGWNMAMQTGQGD